MLEAIIYGAAAGMVVNFLINMVVAVLALIFLGNIGQVDWGELGGVTIMCVLTGAAGSLLYFRAYGHIFIGS